MKSTYMILISILIATSAQAEWKVTSDVNDMTGEVNYYAMSSSTYSTKTMGFPYKGTQSWIGVGCNENSEWTFIGFSNAPNISKTETHDGWNSITTRFKWDSKIKSVELSQEWGASFLHFMGNETEVIKKIQSSRNGLLELDWHSQGVVYFPYSFKGSSKAISTIKNKCNLKPKNTAPNPKRTIECNAIESALIHHGVDVPPEKREQEIKRLKEKLRPYFYNELLMMNERCMDSLK